MMARSEHAVLPRRGNSTGRPGPTHLGGWAPVRLSVNNVQFDDSCLDAEVRIYAAYKELTKDSCTKIERDGSLIGTVNQCRFRLLEAEQ